MNRATNTQRWSRRRAWDWYRQQPWIVGCNFIPSTAINQLEMWQADSFDPDTIDRELGWAATLGFNTVRVYLHDLLWANDAPGLLARTDRFLELADGHGIRTLFVLFDACWNNRARLGPQPEPIAGIHNSGWVQSPSAKLLVEPSRWKPLEGYVRDVIGHFGDDPRVLMWDLYNEPGNEGLIDSSLPLLTAAFDWARQAEPEQPLTAGIWNPTPPYERLNGFQLGASDIVSFHNYDPIELLENVVRDLGGQDRPLLCTEYLARSQGSRFQSHLPLFKRERIGCLNWGLVSGKTQTVHPWDAPYGNPEPELWFHDIFHADGRPFDAEEVTFIRRTIQQPIPTDGG